MHVSIQCGHYEFAEHGVETHDVSDGRTHRSAPTADGEDGWKLDRMICPIFLHIWMKIW